MTVVYDGYGDHTDQVPQKWANVAMQTRAKQVKTVEGGCRYANVFDLMSFREKYALQ